MRKVLGISALWHHTSIVTLGRLGALLTAFVFWGDAHVELCASRGFLT